VVGTLSELGRLGLFCLLAASPAASASLESPAIVGAADAPVVRPGSAKRLAAAAAPYVITRVIFTYAGPATDLRLNLVDKPFHLGLVSRLETAFGSLVFHPGSEFRGQPLRALATTLAKQPSTLSDLNAELQTVVADLGVSASALPEETAYVVVAARPEALLRALQVSLAKSADRAVTAQVAVVSKSCQHLVVRHRRTGRETALAFLASDGRTLDAADPTVGLCLQQLFVRGLFGSEQQLRQQIGVDSSQLRPKQSCVLAELVPASAEFYRPASDQLQPCMSDGRFRAKIIKTVSSRAQLRR